MLVLPMNSSRLKRTLLIVVIEPENLERMKQGDPITLHTDSCTDERGNKGVLRIDYPDNIEITICYEDDPEIAKKLSGLLKEGIVATLEYLHRGYVFDPEKGDGSPNKVAASSAPDSGGEV